MSFKFKLRRIIKKLIAYLPGAIFFIALTATFLLSLSRTAHAHKREAAANLETSLKRAAMVCYALEGRYPESLSYLTENYNIIIDQESFAVFYNIFASNILPEITVVEK